VPGCAPGPHPLHPVNPVLLSYERPRGSVSPYFCPHLSAMPGGRASARARAQPSSLQPPASSLHGFRPRSGQCQHAPVPKPARLPGEPISAPLRMALQQALHFLQLGRTDRTALKDKTAFHAPALRQTSRRVEEEMRIFFACLLPPKRPFPLRVNGNDMNSYEKTLATFRKKRQRRYDSHHEATAGTAV